MYGTHLAPLRLALALTFLLAFQPGGLFAEKMVVALAGGGTDNRGVMLVLETSTGLRTQLSDFGNAAQGPVGMNMIRVDATPDGNLLVVDPFVFALFRVNGQTGQREVVSDFADPGQGQTGLFPVGIALESSGSVLVTDTSTNVLFRIDPNTGQRTVLSDFSDDGQGPGAQINDVTITGTGQILVGDANAGTGGQSALLVVDGTTGIRTVLSDFGNAAQGDLVGLGSVVADPDLGIFVTCSTENMLYRIDAGTGQRTQVADFDDPEHGEIWDFRPSTLEVGLDGLLQVVGSSVIFGGFDLVITVDPATGDRVLLSELSWPQQGATGYSPTGIVRFGILFADGFESGSAGVWSAAVGF